MPRRLLTQPGTPTLNEGADNRESNLIVRVNDEIVPEKSHSALAVKYVVADQLGQGTFGQVFQCAQIDNATGLPMAGAPPAVAVKVVKNKPAYTSQAWVEVRVARLLNDEHGDKTLRGCPAFASLDSRPSPLSLVLVLALALLQLACLLDL